MFFVNASDCVRDIVLVFDACMVADEACNKGKQFKLHHGVYGLSLERTMLVVVDLVLFFLCHSLLVVSVLVEALVGG